MLTHKWTMEDSNGLDKLSVTKEHYGGDTNQMLEHFVRYLEACGWSLELGYDGGYTWTIVNKYLRDEDLVTVDDTTFEDWYEDIECCGD